MSKRFNVWQLFLYVPVLVALWTGNTYAQTFKAGTAVRVITPDPLLPVSGGVDNQKKRLKKKAIYLFAQWYLKREKRK